MEGKTTVHTNNTCTTSLFHLWNIRNNRPRLKITMPHDSILRQKMSKKTLGRRWANNVTKNVKNNRRQIAAERNRPNNLKKII